MINESGEPYTQRVNAIKKEFENTILSECSKFDIYDGWSEIVYDLLKEIEHKYPNIKVLSIKEKFGRLRFYVNDRDNEQLNELIKQAEEKSSRVCEYTGKTGTRWEVNDWWKTTCPEVYSKAERARSWFPSEW